MSRIGRLQCPGMCPSKSELPSHEKMTTPTSGQWMTVRSAPFQQTTKRLYDVGDDERHQNYQEAYLEQWKGRIASESVAADKEYFKFTLNPPSEDFMRVPQDEESFYYIPEQYLQWTWREGRLKQNPANAVDNRSPCYATNRRRYSSSDSKYAFDNGICKILIR